jgi:hypothetical protein
MATQVMGLPPIPCAALSSAVGGLGSTVASLPLPPPTQIHAVLASVSAVPIVPGVQVACTSGANTVSSALRPDAPVFVPVTMQLSKSGGPSSSSVPS